MKGAGETHYGASLRFDFHNCDFLHHISLPDLVDHIEPLVNLAKTGMLAVEVSGIPAVMANEKLRSAGVPSPVGH
jgi:hypothetical protein